MFPYVYRNCDVLQCPSQQILRPAACGTSYPCGHLTYAPGYSMSSWTMHYCGAWDGWIWGPNLRLNQVKAPSTKIWFADGSFRSGDTSSWCNYEEWGPMIAKCEAWVPCGTNQLYPISKRHRGGSNLLFFDGHVEWHTYAEVMPIGDLYSDAAALALYKKWWDPDGDGYICSP